MPDTSLKRLMIFNPSEGRDESREGDKLIYHWAKEEKDLSLTERINDVCLCDASVNVGHKLNQKAKDLSKNSNPQKLVLTFERTLVVILEVEPAQTIWMAVHVGPTTDVQSEVGSESIPVDVIERVLSNIYGRFCLLNGTFQMIATSENQAGAGNRLEEITDDNERRALVREKMRNICSRYFDSILPDIHLDSILSHVASLYNYILYLDLTPLTMMRVNSFINHLVCINIHQIRHTILIFNDQLVWSSLKMNDTRLLYNYMVSVVIRDAVQEELSKEVNRVRRLTESLPIYLTDTDHKSNTISVKSYLTVFRSINMTLGLVFNEPGLTKLVERCEKILTSDSRLGIVPLASLARHVGQDYLKSTSHHQSHQRTSHNKQPNTPAAITSEYIYMDRLDASISWPPETFSKDHSQKLHDNASPLDQSQSRRSKLVKYLIELEPELQENEQEFGSKIEEFYGRTLNDSWLAITNSNYRTIYSMHHTRNATLNEIQQSAVSLNSVFAKNRL